MKICETCVRPTGTTRGGLATGKKVICKIYYLWVTVISPDTHQIWQEKPNWNLKMLLFRMKK